MSKVTINLPADLAQFVETKIAAGEFASPESVVAQALSLMAEIDRQVESPDVEERAFQQAAWKEGIESGSAGVLDFEALKREARRRLAG
jgi:antitoxin ParD1/3/4